ncbi:MAG: monofunctional biosynthetic peptidoglycan transglycosylase [Ignavibacteriales bacterium]|nr:monofunctional biosynthetic peptidoglycan transglycosylase [Ignavibacteriales bacterium]
MEDKETNWFQEFFRKRRERKKKKIDKLKSKGVVYKIFHFIGKLILYFFIITILWVVVYKFVNPPFTSLMLIRYFEDDSEDKSIQKQWVNIDDISPDFMLACIAAEDQLFFEHFGFDIKAIEKAIKYNERKQGKKLKGASTISQQTAKNVFLWPDRTWIRKGLETYFTLLIEIIWGKERIIEVYANVIELGKNIYGVETASQIYFKKSANKITRYQAASLGATIKNPLKRNPKTGVGGRQSWVLGQMGNLENLVKENLGLSDKKK